MYIRYSLSYLLRPSAFYPIATAFVYFSIVYFETRPLKEIAKSENRNYEKVKIKNLHLLFRAVVAAFVSKIYFVSYLYIFYFGTIPERYHGIWFLLEKEITQGKYRMWERNVTIEFGAFFDILEYKVEKNTFFRFQIVKYLFISFRCWFIFYTNKLEEHIQYQLIKTNTSKTYR